MTDKANILDIAHISFLDMIKNTITLVGVASAKGTLIRNAVSTAKKIAEVDYPSFDDYLNATENVTNPIARIEGIASHQGDHVFGLKKCPFAGSIKSYLEVFKELPSKYAEFTVEYNRPSRVSEMYHIGEGAGVSPFCAVHQPMRSAFAERITIGGRKIRIYQLGCKAGSGKKGFADKWISETGVEKEVVDKVLDDHMCCYCIETQ